VKRGERLFKTKIINRGEGKGAVAKAAFNARDSLINEQTGERYDYRCTLQLLFSAIFAPKNAPEWAHERQTLWSEVERADGVQNSPLAREIEISLPQEFNDLQNEYLVKEYVRDNFVRRGIVADVCIHAPDCFDNKQNYHVHILLPLRKLGQDGFGGELRELAGTEQLDIWREQWEMLINSYLDPYGGL
jgi:ATP-dependent exoDNAse (exonuclease V) alpha subunit